MLHEPLVTTTRDRAIAIEVDRSIERRWKWNGTCLCPKSNTRQHTQTQKGAIRIRRQCSLTMASNLKLRTRLVLYVHDRFAHLKKPALLGAVRCAGAHATERAVTTSVGVDTRQWSGDATSCNFEGRPVRPGPARCSCSRPGRTTGKPCSLEILSTPDTTHVTTVFKFRE